MVDVVATFPENYGVDELNGKEAHFNTTINYIEYMSPTQAYLYTVNTSKMKSYPADLHQTMLELLREEAWIVAQAIMKSEGVTRDDDFYKEALATVLSVNGYESKEDAIAADMPEAYIDYQTDIAVAMNLIERLSEGYVEPTPTPVETIEESSVAETVTANESAAESVPANESAAE